MDPSAYKPWIAQSRKELLEKFANKSKFEKMRSAHYDPDHNFAFIDHIVGNVELVVAEEVCEWLVRTPCTDRSYGARPLRRAIQRHIEDPLSEALIRGTVQLGSPIEIYMEGERPGFRSALQAATP